MTETLASFVPILGRALLHFVWQGAVIGVVAALLLRALRDAQRPHARYAVACLALLACALAPLLDIAWQLAAARHAVVPVVVAPAMAALPTLGDTTQALAQAWKVDDALPPIVALWASGACVLLLRMAAGVWWIQRLCRAPQDAVAATWQARLDVLARRFGLQRKVALRLVDAIASPASVGWWRPVVLLPTALLARMPVELVEALLAHELAHIRRHDYLVNLLQGAVEALLFYHPVTWWLSRRIRCEREQVADHLAAQAIGEPRRLALALSELSACIAITERLPSPALAAHGGHLMSRIEQLVRPALRRSRGGRFVFPLLGAVVACVALLAHAQVAGTATDSPAARNATQTAATDVHGERTQRIVHANGNRDTSNRTSYAIVHKARNDITMSGDTRYAVGIETMRRAMDSDFLWFRKGGQEWVITDPSVIARADRAWAPMAPLDRQMEGLDAQMEVHDKKMEALDAKMDALSDRLEDNPETEAASERMDELGRQQEALGEKQERIGEAMESAGEAERERLSRDLQALTAQQEALGEKMEAQSRVIEAASARAEQNAQPMEALGRQMEEAGKPMEALGRQMDAIGKQMDSVSQQAEHETLQLIEEAIAKGLAKPAPARR